MNFNYHMLYSFRYRAIGEGKLEVYDKAPLIFILDHRPNSLLGVNMHWIPKKDRVEFLENVEEIMAKTKSVGKKKERMRLTYLLLKKPKFRIGLEGIRMYYLSGMSSIKAIGEQQWSILFGQFGYISQYKMRKVYKKNDYKE